MSIDKKIESEITKDILSSHIACVLDENFLIYYSNDNFRTLTGFKKDELEGRLIFTLKSSNHTNTTSEFLKKSVESGETWKGELQLQHKDKHTLWLDTTITPVISSAETNMYIATFTDISQLKVLVKNLQQRAHRQGIIAILGQLSLNNIPITDLLEQTLSVVCGSLDIDIGMILELSSDGRNALVRAGYNTNKLTPGKTNISVTDNNMLGLSLQSEQPVISHLLSTEKRFDIPDIFIRENAKTAACLLIGDKKSPFGICCLLTSKVRNLTTDELHFLQSICNILTEAINRKNMETSIRYERELSQKYLDVAEVLIIVFDTKERIILANKHASKVLGYQQEKLKGMNFISTFLPKNIRQKSRRTFSSLLNKETQNINESEFLDKVIPVINRNNNIKHIKWKATLLYDNDNIVNSILFSGEDITQELIRKEEQKNLQIKLYQAQKMEAIGMLAGGIAHDFNNILASILGFSDLIIEKLNPGDGKLLEFITHIKNAGIKARNIIDQMQSLNLHDDSSIKAVPPGSLLKSTMKILRSALPSSINLQLNIQNDIPPVNINASIFHQLIMRLLINSRNNLQGHGDITISLSTQTLKNTCCTTCGSEINSEHVILGIEDNGTGLSKQNLTEVFKHITGDATDSGLANAIKVTHDSGGHILINSKHLDPSYNKPGTNLQLIFNISHKLSATPESSSTKINNINNINASEKHLMIIDDENSVASYLGELFKNAGFTVSVFCDSVEALSCFKNNPDFYDLIITDHTMPALTGYELSSEALKIRQELPIILCSGHSDIINKEKSKNVNIQGYVKKPVASTELLQLVFSLLS